MFGAVAAGAAAGGYDNIVDAASHMARLAPDTYQPNPAAHAVYQRLHTEYMKLHDYFGRGQNDVMKTLKAIRDETFQRP
jgi:L-ribulokinase